MARNWITGVVRVLDRALIVVAAIGLVAMMLHISLDILSSLIFNKPIAFTSAIVTNFYMISVAFLPILAAEYRGNHISVSLLTERLPPRVRSGLETAVIALMAGVYLLLTWQSLQQGFDKLAIGAFVVEQSVKIPVWPSYLMLPAGFGAMTLLLALRVWLRLSGGDPIEPPADHSPEIEHV